MGNLFDLIIAFFDEEGWSFVREPHAPVLMVTFISSNGERYLQVQVAEDQFCIITSMVPLEVPEDRLLDVLDFLNRINGRTALGTFYLDYEGDSIQFSTYIDALNENDEILDKELLFSFLRRSLHYNLSIHDLYLPHVRAVNEGMDVDQAFERAMKDLEGFLS
jgi:hypothetical protein